MILKNFDEAIPFVESELKNGKRIGYSLFNGDLHDGYRAIREELIKHCDFTICSNPQITGPLQKFFQEIGFMTSAQNKEDSIELDNEYTMYRLVGGTVPDSSYPIRTTALETYSELETLYNLVILNYWPVPTPDKIQEVMHFLQQIYIPERQKFNPEFPNTHRHYIQLAQMGGLYYTNKYYFSLTVRVASWKEGFYRFIDKNIMETVLGIKQILIPPVRSIDKMSISTSANVFQEKTDLSSYLNGNLLITSWNETKESLQNKLDSINYEVVRFEKYEGPLIEEYCKKIICVGIKPKIERILGYVYEDAFEFNE